MKKKQTAINWAKVWESFDDWANTFKSKTCSKCQDTKYWDPEWGEQQDKIQQLVEKQLRKGKK